MVYELRNLIDIERVNDLLRSFNKATGFVTVIVDLEGNIISESGWRNICAKFHRNHPDSFKKCNLSDTYLSKNMAVGKKYNIYRCLNGLYNVAVPIIIDGNHVGNLFTGQFFFDKPDKEYFIGKAAELGFDRESYLSALDEVPIVTEDQVKNITDFLLNMTGLINHLTKQNEERDRLIKALSENEEKYRLYIETSDDIIYTLNPEGEFTYVSPAWTKLLGHTLDTVVGHSFQPFVHNDDLSACLHLLENINDPEFKNNSVDYRVKHLDGSWRWHSTKVVVLYGRDGQFIGYMGIARDITERKQAEKENENHKKYLDTIINNIGDPLFVKDEQSRIVLANDAFCEIYDLSREQIYGRTLAEYVSPEEQELFLKIDNQVFEDGNENINEETLTVRDNKAKFISTKKTRFIDSEGKKYLVGIIRDITERKKAEEAMNQKTKELKEYYDLMIGRELKMLDLKKEVNELLQELNREKKYEI